MASLPVFNLSPAVASGLDLLASVALALAQGLPELPEVATSGSGTPSSPDKLHAPGPFNLTASLPQRVVWRILDLEFLEMSEVTADADLLHTPGRPPPPARLPITYISQWVERFSKMAATLVTRFPEFPEKAPELFAYQAQIVWAERNYELGRWVVYNRQFRREGLARKDFNWSVTDTRLYSEAFTGRARAIPRCQFCLQDDHSTPEPGPPMAGVVPASHQGLVPASHWPSPACQRPLAELCRRFNEGRCKQSRCRYTHACRDCGGSHPVTTCPSVTRTG